MAVPPVQANAFTTSMATCFPSPIILLAIAKKVTMLKLSTQPMLLTTIAIAHLSFVPSMLLLTSRTKTKSIAKAHHRLTGQNHILVVPAVFWRFVSLHLSFLRLWHGSRSLESSLSSTTIVIFFVGFLPLPSPPFPSRALFNGNSDELACWSAIATARQWSSEPSRSSSLSSNLPPSLSSAFIYFSVSCAAWKWEMDSSNLLKSSLSEYRWGRCSSCTLIKEGRSS